MRSDDISIDKVAPEQVLRDASVMAGDPDFKRGLTRGWYRGRLRAALDKISFSIQTNKQTTDIKIPDDWNLQYEIPGNIVDIDEIYLWNGADCNVQSSVWVFHKERLNNKPGGQNYTAMWSNTNSMYDPMFITQFFVMPLNNGFILGKPIVYANIQNGVIMFSPTSTGWQNIRLVYDGTIGDFDTIPLIPRYCLEFCTDFVYAEALRVFMTREPARGLAGVYDRAMDRMYGRTGSYYELRKFIKKDPTWGKTNQGIYEQSF